VTFPPDWNDLALQAREATARTVAISIGQYLAFTAMTWHEILTWFGYRPKGLGNDFPSAFSWEDTYSNLLGTRVAASALRNAECDFSEAVTMALQSELNALAPQSGERAEQLTQQLRGLWFRKKYLFITEITKRNLDLGADDGKVTPSLIAEASDCEGARARSLPVPTLGSLTERGFSIEVEIKPREWEQDQIWIIVEGKGGERGQKLDPTEAFPPIMAHIAEEAVNRYDLSL
jgi:hypothetical protein